MHLFAALFLSTGVAALIAGLSDITASRAQFAAIAPWFGWNRDWVIVALSARFTIVCIPVIAIWAFASGVARWLITGFTGLAILRTIAELSDSAAGPGMIIEPIMLGLACALLFAPSARRWLKRGASASTDGGEIS